MSNELILSAYGSHNAAITMYYKGEYTVVEVERWLNSKNIGLCNYLPSYNMQLVFDEICEYLLAKTDRVIVDVYITGYMGKIIPKFKYKKKIKCDHHVAHAAGAFYQSPYEKAVVYTYDGGGDGGFFNVYMADRNNGITLLHKFDQDLGFAYMILADYLEDIKKDQLNIGNLVYAGKLMGLCSYGKVREEWLPHFETFYSRFNYTGNSYLGGAETKMSALNELFDAIGVADFDVGRSRYTGQFAWDIAATTQKAFENQFFKYARASLDEHADLPIALSGGCALNVLLNTLLLKERNGNVYVPPNTNDCGISAGALLWHMAPKEQVDLTYSGLPILDAHLFSEYMEDRAFHLIKDIAAPELARFVADGNIVGVIQGNSEHGSRALGNRSIICNPIVGMKDTLNKNVKDREWYRPFAPIVRVDDVHKYFDFAGTESRHMVFVAGVKDEWKTILPAITHEDGTGRLQTVTREQNPLIYDIITAFEPLAGHSVILNTSFNVNGKPILTRLSDALEILRKSKLDAVYYKGHLICRAGDARRFKHYGVKKPVGLTDKVTVYLNLFDPKLKKNTPKYVRQINSLKNIPDIFGIVITDATSADTLRAINNPYPVHSVGVNRHYYSQVINSVKPHWNSTMDFADTIKLLWAKEAIKQNYHRTLRHIIIDLPKCIDLDLEVLVRKTIAELALSDGNDTLVSAKEALGDSKHYIDIYDGDTAVIYTPHVIAGMDDDLDWILTNYEGIMHRCVAARKIGTESDYLTISSLENSDRYRPFYYE